MQEYKFIIIGNSGVGKTCILDRMVFDRFQDNHDVTIGVNFQVQMMQIESTQLKLQLWDTAGQEIYRAITQSYYRDTDVAIIVYDITDQGSFNSLKEWVDNVRSHAPATCIIGIVGNKKDLETTGQRKVSYDDGKIFAESHNFPFFETSALTGENVRALFEHLAFEAYATFQNLGGRKGRERRISSETNIWTIEKQDEKGSCC